MRLQTAVTEPPVVSVATWPDAVTFQESIQNPVAVLADEELRDARVVLNRSGLPLAYSGRFAVVFRLQTPGGADWAVRCFTQSARADERRARYDAVARRLEGLPDCFVPFRYLEQGIRVGAAWFPVVAMRWAQGQTLGRFVENHLGNPPALIHLCDTLNRLLHNLEGAGIAHGDWQHDNLLVSDEGRRVTLVDYDGMFVPELSGRASPEVGHPNYQHPARTAEHYGPGMDRFSCLAMQTGLLALAKDASLWARFSDGESLLFKRADFSDPPRSALFQTVRCGAATRESALADALSRLDRALEADPDRVLPPPALAEVPPVSAASHFPVWWAPPGGACVAPAGRRARRRRGRAAYRAIRESAEYKQEQRKYRNGVRGLMFALGFLTLTMPGVVQGLSDSVGPAPAIGWFFLWAYGLFWVSPDNQLRLALLRAIRREEAAIARLGAVLHRMRWTAGCSPNGGVTRFVTRELGEVSLWGSLILGNVNPLTVLQLRAEGVATAADVRNQGNVAGVAQSQYTAIRNWVRGLEERAERRFAEMAQRQDELSERMRNLERERADRFRRREALMKERTLFPETTPFRFWLRVFEL